ncbi:MULTISPECIES: cupin domain-containing protein [Nostocales]|uniref:Cupin domain-containing protein n=3 Tax=Nostocales TaxID=1161 RepID=A0A8S9TDY5_9CYAN|nr:cupin domain-containing protein [Tolypothrix bouteillei]KAF3889814.1 cupin domain-containing protein [Tolypothrix bouteillei VB521301]
MHTETELNQENTGEQNTGTEDATSQVASQEPLILTDQNRPGYWLVGDHPTFVATGEQTNGEYALLDFYTVPQGGPFPHIHRQENEFAYILEGEVSYQLNDQVVTATPGTFIYKHQNDTHGFLNLGDTASRHLEFVFPAGLEQAFAEIGVPGSVTSPPPNEIPPAEALDRFSGILAEYGVETLDSIIFHSSEFNKTRTGDPQVTLLRPGEAEGEVSATLALSNGLSVEVDFADGQRTQTVALPISSNTTDDLRLTITNPTNGAVVGLLQDEAVLSFADDGSYTLKNGDTPETTPKLEPNNEQREKYWLGGDLYTYVATAADTEGKLSLFDVYVPPGTDNEDLISAPTDKGFFVLEGNVTFEMEDQSFTATPNTYVLLPEDKSFALTNQGTLPAEVLMFTTTSPTAIESFIASMGTAGDISNPPPSILEPTVTSDISAMIATESIM